MIKAIIVDDEKWALHHLENILEATGVVDVTSYLDAQLAFKKIKEAEPDVIFLDISMPEYSGIELASEIMMLNKDSKIIFITAYEQHAVKAFELGATDYVLKPYSKKRIHNIVHKINDLKRLPNDQYTIHAFNHFHIKKNGKEIKNIKWRTSKGRELLAYLVQHSEDVVRKDILADLFWPEHNTKNAYDNLYTTIYQLRKTLESLDVDIQIINSQHGYEVTFHTVKYDVLEWDKVMQELNKLIEEKDKNMDSILKKYKEALSYYKGHYLAEESNVWKENLKEQYMISFFFVSKKVIELLRENEQRSEAILLTLHIRKLYPHLDFSYFTLMQLYSEIGDRHRVESHYLALKKMLDKEFGAVPDHGITKWYKDWMMNQYLRK